MKINKTTIKFRFLFMLLLIMIVACTIEDEQIPNNLLAGSWEADEFSSIDHAYGANWRINRDESFHMEFGTITIAGQTDGHSSGTYGWFSDSIFVVHSIDHENLWMNWAFGNEIDTLLIRITDFGFTSTAVHVVGPLQYEKAGPTISWVKHID